MRRTLFAVVLGLAAFAAAPGFAQSGHGQMDHSTGMLSSSVPADGATLSEAPRTLALRFAHPVVLQTVAITGPEDTPVPATFRRPPAAAANYSIALPALAEGVYTARWTASGMGHNMQGELTFTVQ